jgi:outer membrane protein OmpA-like peptidoglycan-associated protein
MESAIMQPLNKANFYMAFALGLSLPAQAQDLVTRTSPSTSIAPDTDNPEVLEIIELKGSCEQSLYGREQEHHELHPADRLRAMDSVRCRMDSYAIGQYTSTKKTTTFTGISWSPVGFPSLFDPALRTNERAGRVARSDTYREVDAARKATAAVLGAGPDAATNAGIGAMVGAATGSVSKASQKSEPDHFPGTTEIVKNYRWTIIKGRLSGVATETGTEVTEQGDGSIKLAVPGSNTFPAGNDVIKPSFASLLDGLAQTLQLYPEVIANVISHGDNASSTSDNLALSQKRDDSVKSYLEKRGVASARLSDTRDSGTPPLSDSDVKNGRAEVRNVEIWLLATKRW